MSFTRELEGSAATADDLSPRSALSLSRGTADQLYLSLRLAVCRLCLPEKPPIVLDDALAAFDDQRLGQALDLLQELAQDQPGAPLHLPPPGGRTADRNSRRHQTGAALNLA